VNVIKNQNFGRESQDIIVEGELSGQYHIEIFGFSDLSKHKHLYSNTKIMEIS
jgi:hypothetical protein